MSLKKIEQSLFYLLVFLIPCNLGKHWPQPWSYVGGILIDYLIPTLYLTDILILVLLLTWLLEFLKSKIKNKKSKISFNPEFKTEGPIKYQKFLSYSFILLFYCLINILMAKNRPAAIYKWLKLSELGLLFFWLQAKRSDLAKVGPLRKILGLSVIWQSVLTLIQWFKQGSVFGYWFFGEQPFNPATLGIKKINFLGQVKVLPLGTFPHPNVLAGFLVVSLLLFISLSAHDRRSVMKCLTLGLGGIALGLTFSLPAWTLMVVSGGWWVVGKFFKNKRKTILIPLVSLFLTSLLIWLTFLSKGGLKEIKGEQVTSVSRRITLNKIAIKMWLSSPLIGVGLNNFIPRMEEFGQVVANYRFLQPAHNIYLLVLAETGIIGEISLIWLIWFISQKLRKRKKFSLLFTVYCLLFTGLFDHYWLTLQQGMLMMVLVGGIISIKKSLQIKG